jgi:aspartyl/asparaginyl beta-hydroxylase (cupin superfamily)
VHLPIEIPGVLPDCGIEIAGLKFSWTDPVAFCDAHLHTAWNHTDKERIVMILDILRPDCRSSKKSVCNNLHSLLRLQNFLNHKPVFHRSPWFVKGGLRYFFKASTWMEGRYV